MIGKNFEVDEFALSFDELMVRFPDSGLNPSEPNRSSGLGSAQAATVLEQDGPNRLTPPKTVSLWKLYFEQASCHVSADLWPA